MKKTFVIEQYQLYSEKFTVEAESLQDAVEEFAVNGGDAVDNSTDYIEIATKYGEDSVRTVETPDGEEIMWDRLPNVLKEEQQG